MSAVSVATTAASRALSLQRLDDWPLLIERGRANTPPRMERTPTSIDADGRDLLIRYNRTIGVISTADTARVGEALNRVIEANEYAPHGGRRTLLIDGASTMGKTMCIETYVTTGADRVWRQRGRRVNGREQIPYVYVEAESGGRGRALMQSILHFIGLPYTERESAEILTARLRDIAPELGLKAVIIDDAHMLRTNNPDSRRLTDFLKHIITSLPVTFAFVGAGLASSALLQQSTRGDYPASEQISRRAKILTLTPWPHERLGDDWTRLIANLERRLVLTQGPVKGVLTTSSAIRLLHERSAGHPGMMIEWVKDAATTAISEDRRLTLDLLKATAPPRPRSRT